MSDRFYQRNPKTSIDLEAMAKSTDDIPKSDVLKISEALDMSEFEDFKSKKTIVKEKKEEKEDKELVDCFLEQRLLVKRYEKCIDRLINVIEKQSNMINQYQNLIGLILLDDRKDETND